MLILTRRIGETIIIGEGDRKISIMIISIYGNQIKIGIDAPRDIAVNRQEIYDRVLAERGEVKSFAVEKQQKPIEVNEDNIGNRIDSEKTKRTIKIINKKRPLIFTGKP